MIQPNASEKLFDLLRRVLSLPDDCVGITLDMDISGPPKLDVRRVVSEVNIEPESEP